MAWTGSAPNQTFSRGNGVHSGSTTWAQDEAAATGIVSDRHDTHDQDIATSLNLALLKNGGNTLTASIPAGGFGMTGMGVLSTATEVNVTAASTSDVLSQASLQVLCTGAGATITSLGSTAKVARKRVRFDGINTLTHNATSLILPGAANITTASGDRMEVESDASGNARVTWYQRAASPPGGQSAGMVVLTSGSVSAAATLDIVLTSYTAYRGIIFKLYKFLPVNDGAVLQARFSTDGGSNYDASGYNYAMHTMDDTATIVEVASGSANAILMSGGVGNASTEGVWATCELLGQTSTAFWSRIFFSGYHIDTTATPRGIHFSGGGSREAAQDTDAIRFMFSTGNIASGDYAVYGLV